VNVEARPCKRCGMRIEFHVGPNGKAIPLQRVRTVYAMRPDATIANVTSLVYAAEGVYASHFETCPHASDFSKGARG
jgi:hypothetical protein